ncbi:hypothetical protein SLA2020_110690 [Shorea laevis]
MSNGSTWEECLKRKLFGLPFSHAEFVKRVKVGMILFLFEYEKRQLYGVFKAASDGDINIVSKAYDSSGRLFPAQVRVTRIWNCDPLSEHEFYHAIRGNYFAKNKFNFGLSLDQVYELLRLFDSRKLRHLVPQSCIRYEAGERGCMSSITKAKVGKHGCHYTEKARKKLKMDVDVISESNLHSLAYSDRFSVADDSRCSATRNSIYSRKVSKNMCYQRARREVCFQSSIAYVSTASRHGLGHHYGTTRKQWVNSGKKRKELDISSRRLDGNFGDLIALSPSSDDHDTEDFVTLLSPRDLDPREFTSKARGKEYNNKADESVLRVRSKKDFITEADKSAKEITEELQRRHGNGDKNREFTSKARGKEYNNKADESVLRVRSKKDFITEADKSAKEITEELQRRHGSGDKNREFTSKARGKEYNNKADESVLRVRSKKDFITGADKSAKEITEELQRRHGNGDKKWRRARSFEKKNTQTEKERRSVFLRLN